MPLISHEYSCADDSVGLRGQIAMPAGGGPAPVVMVAHAWGGCGKFEQECAERLSADGYIGFAVDVYGEGRCSDNIDEKSALMQPLLDNRALLLLRISAALDEARKLPGSNGKVAGIGFCFGGLTMLDLARSGADFAGLVSFHGALAPPGRPTNPIKVKLLVLNGHCDPMVPSEQVAEFQKEVSDAGADWQLVNYSDAMHSFSNPAVNEPSLGMMYHQRTAERAWRAMDNFLVEALA